MFEQEAAWANQAQHTSTECSQSRFAWIALRGSDGGNLGSSSVGSVSHTPGAKDLNASAGQEREKLVNHEYNGTAASLRSFQMRSSDILDAHAVHCSALCRVLCPRTVCDSLGLEELRRDQTKSSREDSASIAGCDHLVGTFESRQSAFV